jgi:hypothetical protein
MFARLPVSTALPALIASFALGGMAGACSSSSAQDGTTPKGDIDSGIRAVDDSAVVDGAAGTEVLDAGARALGVDAPLASGGDATDAYGWAGEAGVLAFCTAFCAFARECVAVPEGGADGGAAEPCDCRPASLGIQRADYVADITSCLAGLDAGACGDAAASASDCVSRAGAMLTPSPSAVSFCKVDEISACPLRGCLDVVGLYGDPTVEKFPACLPEGGTPITGDGGCDGFKACLTSAVTP